MNKADILDLITQAEEMTKQSPQKAYSLAELAYKEAKKVEDKSLEAYTTFTLANLSFILARYPQAISLYQEALVIFESLNNRGAIGAVLGGLGVAYNSLGDYQRAIGYCEEALNIAEEIGDRENEGGHLGNLGNAHFSMGQYQEAIEHYNEALEIAKEIGNRYSEGSHLGNLGNVYRSLGQYEKAIGYHESALKIAKEIGNRYSEGSHLGNLGNVYRSLGQYEKAIGYYNEALGIAKEIGDRQGEGNRLGNLGNTYSSLGQYEKAIGYYNEALGIAKEIGDRKNEGSLLGNLGVAYHSLGQYEKAIEQYNEALEIAKEIGDRQGEGNRLGNLGNAYSSLGGQYEKAIGYYNEALEIAKEIGDVNTERLAYLEIGEVYTEFYKDLDKAYEYYERSIELLEDMRSLITKREYKMEGLLPRQGISAYDRIILNIVSRKEKNYEEAWEYAERSKAQNLAELLKEEVPLSKDKIKPIISKETAIVEFFVTEKETIVFILIEGKSLSETTIELEDFKESDLRDLINNWFSKYYEHLSKYKDYKNKRNETTLSAYLKASKDWHTTMEDTLKSLYENLFSKINELLTKSNIEHIIIVPHRALHLLPLHAAFIERDGRREYLIDKYNISYAPSSYILSLCQGRDKKDNNSFLGINNPDMSLRFSDWEIDQVKSHFKKQNILRHSDATREAILREAPMYGVIHFSCHGEFNPWAPLESSLILANVPLTLRDIFKELKLPNTSMVVLSACETGMSKLSESDEYVGLPSGFLYAGSPLVIGSLWTVDDESTALLMEKFYENLYKNGLNKAEALRDAQVWLRNKYKDKDYSHPYYWAGFFACGEVG